MLEFIAACVNAYPLALLALVVLCVAALIAMVCVLVLFVRGGK
ncbi:hypothetical protein [Arthrobacter woluwensis]|nr:hypothetical protein [Arthrobacter woluwensis]